MPESIQRLSQPALRSTLPLTPRSPTELRRLITTHLNRTEIGVLWFELFASPMDEDLPGRSSTDCVIELLSRVQKRTQTDALLKILERMYPHVLRQPEALPASPGQDGRTQVSQFEHDVQDIQVRFGHLRDQVNKWEPQGADPKVDMEDRDFMHDQASDFATAVLLFVDEYASDTRMPEQLREVIDRDEESFYWLVKRVTSIFNEVVSRYRLRQLKG